MKLNCKVGDIAVIVGAEDPWSEMDVGKFVRVVEAGDDWSSDGDSRFHWAIRSASGGLLACCDGHWQNPTMGSLVDIPDAMLRPLRDPGADAVDEMVIITGRPEEVAA
jgi:hypothetical protein